MIRKLLLFLITGISHLAAGQEGGAFSRGISINLNLGIPVSTFASVDRTSDESGYAQAGVGFDVTYFLMSPKPYGFVGTFRYQSFGYDMDAVVDNHKAMATPGEWYGEGENWKMLSMLVGGYWDAIHSESFAFGLRAQVGWLMLSSKDRYISGIGSGGSYNVRIDYHNESSSGFTYVLGLSMRTSMSPKVNFITGIDYMNAAPSVQYNSKFTSAAVVVATNSGTFTQPINALLISAGFIFEI